MAPRTRDQLGRFAKAPVPTRPAAPDPLTYKAPTFPLAPPEKSFVGTVAVPHHVTFSAIWQAYSRSYLTLDDEAKRNNYQNALALRRDASIMKSIRARQVPVAQLGFILETEDPDEEEQQKVAKELTAIVNAIPRFQQMKLNLSEAIWFGKAGSQLKWDWRRVAGKKFLIPVDHFPINGDKIVSKWSGELGILTFKSFQPEGADLEPTNWGPALYLFDDYWRDRFVIHKFEPDDTDYLFESELSGSILGVGLRSRLYWVTQLRDQVLSWITDALQRISTNGLLVGYYPTGNQAAQLAIQAALEELATKSVTTVPVDKGNENQTRIDSINPSSVAYDVLLNCLKYFDSIIEVMILGQPLSSSTASTGMGSEVAELHSQTLESLLIYDANSLSETLTTDLLAKIIKYNYGDLGFNVKLKLVTDKVAQKDLAVSAKALFDMQVPLDQDDLREQLGFKAPRSDATQVLSEEPKDNRIGDQDKMGDFSTHTELEGGV